MGQHPTTVQAHMDNICKLFYNTLRLAKSILLKLQEAKRWMKTKLSPAKQQVHLGLFRCLPPPPPSPTDKIIIPPPLADAQLSSMVQVSV